MGDRCRCVNGNREYVQENYRFQGNPRIIVFASLDEYEEYGGLVKYKDFKNSIEEALKYFEKTDFCG